MADSTTNLLVRARPTWPVRRTFARRRKVGLLVAMMREVDRRAFRCLAPLAVVLATACSRTPTYLEQIAAFRADKDLFMRASPQSPVPEDRRAEFPPLKYFPIDPASRVP